MSDRCRDCLRPRGTADRLQCSAAYPYHQTDADLAVRAREACHRATVERALAAEAERDALKALVVGAFIHGFDWGDAAARKAEAERDVLQARIDAAVAECKQRVKRKDEPSDFDSGYSRGVVDMALACASRLKGEKHT